MIYYANLKKTYNYEFIYLLYTVNTFVLSKYYYIFYILSFLCHIKILSNIILKLDQTFIFKSFERINIITAMCAIKI